MLAFDEGEYVARIINWGLSTTKTKGTPQIFWTFVCDGMVDTTRPGELVGCSQYERTIFRVLTENTIEYAANDLQQLGYPYSTFDQLEKDHPQAHDFGNQEVRVRCKYEDYNGKQVERWSFAFGNAAYAPEKMASQEVKKLNALFGKQLKSAKTHTEPVRRPATAQQPAQRSQEPEESVF